MFGSNLWKILQIRNWLEPQSFRALSLKTWRRQNNYKQVCRGRFALFRSIMFLLSALSIFIAASACLELIFLLVEEVILKEWWGRWNESCSYSVTGSGLAGIALHRGCTFSAVEEQFPVLCRTGALWLSPEPWGVCGAPVVAWCMPVGDTQVIEGKWGLRMWMTSRYHSPDQGTRCVFISDSDVIEKPKPFNFEPQLCVKLGKTHSPAFLLFLYMNF